MITDPNNHEVAHHMRQTRRNNSTPRDVLAYRSSVGYQSIRSYETGRTLPGLANLWRLCDTLDVSMDEYTGFDQYRKARKGELPQ
jgi:transcriptional regulator with XRE-family HTH domain